MTSMNYLKVNPCSDLLNFLSVCITASGLGSPMSLETMTDRLI
jgi:hypothetical protein